MSRSADPEASATSRDGTRLFYRRRGLGRPLVLLHATLSRSAHLAPLIERLAGRFTVLAPDRRSPGVDDPDRRIGAVDVGIQVDDVTAVLDAAGVATALVAGHSYGACVALELAARRPERVLAVWGYEPPYGPAASGADRARMAAIGEQTIAAASERGVAAAGEAFFAAVAGNDALERLSRSARREVRRAGPAALAEAPLLGLDLDGLSAARCPVALVVGGASPPLYRTIARALEARMPSGRVEILPGADHRAPVNRPDAVAESILAFAARVGV